MICSFLVNFYHGVWLECVNNVVMFIALYADSVLIFYMDSSITFKTNCYVMLFGAYFAKCASQAFFDDDTKTYFVLQIIFLVMLSNCQCIMILQNGMNCTNINKLGF